MGQPLPPLLHAGPGPHQGRLPPQSSPVSSPSLPQAGHSRKSLQPSDHSRTHGPSTSNKTPTFSGPSQTPTPFLATRLITSTWATVLHHHLRLKVTRKRNICRGEL